MSILKRMLSGKPRKFWFIARWNDKYNAVEILHVRSPYDTGDYADDFYDFLTLPAIAKEVMVLEYLDDGTVLSARARNFQSIEEWAEECKRAGMRTSVWAKGRANATLELNQENSERWIEIGDIVDTFTVVLDNQKFPGFPNHLTAERFLMRLLPREKGLYFLDGSDEELFQLFDSNPDDQRLNWNTLSVGYGDMPYSISSNNQEGETDSIYFTWLDLPERFSQYVVLQSALDCNTSHFCEDFEADVVAIEDLDRAMQGMIDCAIGWFVDNNVPFDLSEVEELRKTIVADIQREYPETHPQIRSMPEVLKLFKIEAEIDSLDFAYLEQHLTSAVASTYGNATVQTIVIDEEKDPEAIGIFILTVEDSQEQGTEFFFPFSQQSLLQCLNQLKKPDITS